MTYGKGGFREAFAHGAPAAEKPALVHYVFERDAEILERIASGEFEGPDRIPPPLPAAEGFPDFEESLAFTVSVYCSEEAPYFDLDTRAPETMETWPPEIYTSSAVYHDWHRALQPVPDCDHGRVPG